MGTSSRREEKVPHFVFGATNLDDELYFRGSGKCVFDDRASGELTPDSIFWICSQTKFIAAVRPDSFGILSSSPIYQIMRWLLCDL